MIGRFVVLGAIGSGSMGTVFAAYDPVGPASRRKAAVATLI